MNRPDNAIHRVRAGLPLGRPDRKAILEYLAQLERDGFELSAGVCPLLAGNEHGNPYCRGTGKLIEVMQSELAADLLGDPRQRRLPLDPEERVLGDVCGPYNPAPPLPPRPWPRVAEAEGAVQNETDGAANIDLTCAVCGSEPGELCRRDSLVCEFVPKVLP